MEKIKLSDLTERQREWVLSSTDYKKLVLCIHLVAGKVYYRYGVYRLSGNTESILMMTKDPKMATDRYNAIQELSVLSEPPAYIEEDAGEAI